MLARNSLLAWLACLGRALGGGELLGALAHLSIERRRQLAQVAVQIVPVGHGRFQLAVGVGEPRLHAVDVVDQRGDFRGSVRHRSGPGRACSAAETPRMIEVSCSSGWVTASLNERATSMPPPSASAISASVRT